jgi:hypothetical protein
MRRDATSGAYVPAAYVMTGASFDAVKCGHIKQPAIEELVRSRFVFATWLRTLLPSVPSSNGRTRRKRPWTRLLSLVGAGWERTIA